MGTILDKAYELEDEREEQQRKAKEAVPGKVIFPEDFEIKVMVSSGQEKGKAILIINPADESVLISKKDPTLCACGNRHHLVSEFGACGKCMNESM